MNEIDDRLDGDPVWELFANPRPSAAQSSPIGAGKRLLLLGLVVLSWFVCPPLAVLGFCLAVATPDFREGRRLARSMPNKAGGKICARFSYAWAAFKFGVASSAMMLLLVNCIEFVRPGAEAPLEFMTALFQAIAGFSLSAMLTASGLVAAYGSGMRIWIGEGVNRARSLLLGMLVAGFAYGVLVPLCISLIGTPEKSRGELLGMMLLLGSLVVGPVPILVILDRISRRVLAESPGKFGPKVATVGKWNSSIHA